MKDEAYQLHDLSLHLFKLNVGVQTLEIPGYGSGAASQISSQGQRFCMSWLEHCTPSLLRNDNSETIL